MKLRKQIVVSEDAWQSVLDLTSEANTNFDLGQVTYSDTVEAMILNAKVGVDVLRAQCADLKKTLKAWSMKKDPDLDLLIDDLNKLKGKTTKRRPTNTSKEVQ